MELNPISVESRGVHLNQGVCIGSFPHKPPPIYLSPPARDTDPTENNLKYEPTDNSPLLHQVSVPSAISSSL
eukprot:jgi/Psemu1/42556/gm1.42556_g